MTDRYYEYLFPLLRNFEVGELYDFLSNSVPDFRKKYRNSIAKNGWAKITEIINIEVSSNYDDTDFDDFLFEKLAFDLQDHAYLLNLNTNLDVNTAIDMLKTSTAFDRKLSTIIRSDELMVSLRQHKSTLIILFKVGVVRLGNEDHRSIMYVSCIIDFENKLIQFRFRRHYLARIDPSFKQILDQLVDYVNSSLGIEITASYYNEAVLHNVLYKIFTNVSQDAEDLIMTNLDGYKESEFDKKIKIFLENDLQVSVTDDYVERIRSVLYQNTALQISQGSFNTFIFGFTFFDRDIIRSSTRNPTREPVYHSKIYWNLKSLIHEYKEITEISVYWRFKDGENELFVEVGLREIYGTIEIHFYHTLKSNREVKEGYVLQQITKHLR